MALTGIPCKYVTVALGPDNVVLRTDGQPLQAGDMYEAPWILSNPKRLASRWSRVNRPRRDPMVVCIPTRTGHLHHFCIDDRFYDEKKGGYYGDGWTIKGVCPKYTLTPSINIVGRYHGHITNGIITPDQP